MARFFIDRPIFAWVIALFILVFGGVAITQLPVAQYPTVAPPSLVISVAYPGAWLSVAGAPIVNDPAGTTIICGQSCAHSLKESPGLSARSFASVSK